LEENHHRFRPTWVEVSLASIAHNTRAFAAVARAKGVGLIAVVKADGYGHGALETAKTALAHGAQVLAVALPEEGAVLREHGIEAPILVMGAYVPGTVQAYQQYSLMATISDFDQLKAAAAEARSGRLAVHLKVDTGMGRLGVLPQHALALAQKAKETGNLEVVGVYSHLATADEVDDSFAYHQIAVFEDILSDLEKHHVLPPMRHILNTAGLLRFDAGRTTMARVGLGLYGLYPAPHLKGLIELRPALTWKSRVATVKRVPAGTGVSYGQVYHTPKETTLATIPVGYADGFRRGLSGRAHVLIGGKKRPVLGRICMDQTIVDVGDDAVAPGDEVVLIGQQGNERIDADDWARWLDTINYEIICGVSARVPRVYR
jgi:alanine racemase